MTTFIILRIKGINNVLQIVLGFIYLIACIFFSVKSIRNAKENTLEEMNKKFKDIRLGNICQLRYNFNIIIYLNS